MLFQRLYNWIKYKTLPSSFLFKNRLFIERDSKHRRIFSNFGLNFRSSKWSMYETYNIKTKSKTSFSKYLYTIFCIVFLTVFILNYSKYYITLNFFNNLAFFVWIIADSFDYYFSFILWIMTSLLSVFFNTVYSYFFFNNFSKKKDFESFSSTFKTKFSNSTGLLSSGKEDLNWIFYSWITNSNSTKSPKIVESLFDTTVNKSWWSKFYDFFPTLYKSLFTLNQVTSSMNIFEHASLVNKKSPLFNFVSDSRSFFSYYDVIFYYFLKQNETKSGSFDKKTYPLYQWNINLSSSHNLEYSFLTKTKNGLFFIDNLNYAKFNHLFSNFSEFWSLNFFLKNQIDSAKWNRWLYRYSTLHRKILKTSHKLTLSKKLINNGFYDNNLFNKNIWAAENFSKFSNNNFIFNTTNLSYQNSSSSSNSLFSKFDYSGLTSVNNAVKTSILSFYENSYFWFLKRNYILNSLSTNTINSNLKINRQVLLSLANVKADNDLKLAEHYSNVYYFLASDVNSISLWNKKFHDFSSLHTSNFSTLTTYSLKDIQVFLSDLDTFSKDNSMLLSWISSTTSLTSANTYLKYLSTTSATPLNILFPTFYTNFSSTHPSVAYYFLLSSANIDNFYIKDVFYKNLFN